MKQDNELGLRISANVSFFPTCTTNFSSDFIFLLPFWIFIYFKTAQDSPEPPVILHAYLIM